ncbi:MAG TPA: fibronectin type III domain-containing protein [Microlunatus sp.]
MATGIQAFPGRPFQLRIEVWYNWQSGASASMHVEVWVDKLSYSPTSSASGSTFQVYVDSVGLVVNYSGGFDFVNGNNFLIHSGDYAVTVSIYGDAGAQVYADFDILGHAQCGATYDGTALSVPPAPSPLSLDQITLTEIRYRFNGTGSGGSPIIRWEVQIDDDPAFGSAVIETSTGTKTHTGLAPGTKYYFRSRGVNAIGNGAWSSVLNATTLPADPPTLAVTPSASGQNATVVLTAPGGVTGATGWEVDYRIGSAGTVTTVTSATSPVTVTGLLPGTTYEWRARVKFGAYTSPSSAYVAVYQPNPNTNPGTYFDGATADSPDVDYAWTGTAHLSTTTATGVSPLGWSVAGTGGASIIQRVTGGRSGTFAARVTVQTTSTNVRAGMQPAAPYGADVEAGATYFGSVYAWTPAARSLTPEIAWYNAAWGLISRTTGIAVALPAGSGFWTRLVVSGVAPALAEHAVMTLQAVGSTVGGTTWTMDDAAVTLAALFDWFSGDSPDTAQYAHTWEGVANQSVSARATLADTGFDPLADPDCPPLPTPPSAPVIYDPCIDEVGTWRRYWAPIPASAVTRWLEVVPTFRLTTQAEPARQVRVRIYPNPDALSSDQFDASAGWESEQIISFIPPGTTIRLDGVSERVRASVGGGDWIAADQLLYGTGGAPAEWPLLDCGIGYLVAFDAPLDADPENLALDVELTRRY